jgi:ribonucleoside-diphosphate reductase alpha chain
MKISDLDTLKCLSLNELSSYNHEPQWALDNPYLNILSSRFFNETNIKWSDLPRRVGRLYLSAEIKYCEYSLAVEKAKEIVSVVSDGAFLPNSPVMMNSESETNINLFACHVLSPPSDMNDFDVAKKIHDGCGGIGYDFSKMDDPITATAIIEKETAELNPNRKRKAHSAVTLSYKHPKIIDFIHMGSKLTITHTNIEVDDTFFKKIANKDHESLEIWDALCESIYNTGRPSLSFGSEKDKRSNTKLINNVCGESLLRENESSLIGSLNLTKFVINDAFDFARFQKVARLGLRCLDNLHDIQDHASNTIKSQCLESRKVGVGVMGYSDTLLLLNIRYGSHESLMFVEKLMALLKSTLIDESEKIGKERGFCNTELLKSGEAPRRNASLMAIPANGTLSLIANVSGGIEPIFTYLIKQTIQEEVIYQLQPTFKRLLNKNNIDFKLVFEQLMSGKKIASIQELPPQLMRILVEANDLAVEEHISTQAKFQSFIDGGISKTINLPFSSTVGEIKDAIILAKESFCVGISLYRNGSLQYQPTQMVN